MGWAAAAMAGAQVGGAYLESESIKSQGKFAERQADFNARMAELQAEDATFRGEKKANDVRRIGKQFTGEQRVAAGAQGVDISLGSPADVISGSKDQIDRDIMDVKNNAWRESFGYRSQAADFRRQGRMARLESKNRAFNTLISAGLGAGATSFASKGKGK